MNYGIIGEGFQIIKFTNAKTINSFAMIYLKRIVNEEGFKFNNNGLSDYLESWLEYDVDMAEESDREPCTKFSEIIDEIADNITYTNVHLQKSVNGSDWIPISSDEKVLFYNAIVDKLDSVPELIK